MRTTRDPIPGTSGGRSSSPSDRGRRESGAPAVGTRAAEREEPYELVRELFPICRSITGNGVRETLGRVADRIPLRTVEVPSGTRVLDWTVPQEWNIRGGWIRDPTGRTVVDFRDSNLHIVGYSVPVRKKVSLSELRTHVHTLPEQPDRVPYRTSYYQRTWGFCMEHRRLEALPEGEYEVCVDSSLEAGSLTYGECFLPGETEEEVLVSTHVCHPSLCNDNLSGIAVATALARQLASERRRYSYRFLFVPVTIGAIAWLARNEEAVARVRHGLVLAGVGDRGQPTYKRSRRGNADVDRAMTHVLQARGTPHTVEDFVPYGYDERQYCSPGFDLPVGCLMRTPWGRYPEYHTSGDDLSFVADRALEDSLQICRGVVEVLEHNRAYLNRSPKGEPQLGKRGLYDGSGTERERHDRNLARLWVLNQSDGRNDLLAIAERSGMPFSAIRAAAEALTAADLLEPIP